MKIRPITITAAKEFVREHHRHNKPPVSALWATSAVVDGEVVGVAIVGRPVARKLDNGDTVEVIRCCVLDHAPKGTNSFLYGAVRRQAQTKGYVKVLTYTLQRESGASLRGAGWKPKQLPKPSKGKGWQTRDREYQDVYAEPKIRWETTIGEGIK